MEKEFPKNIELAAHTTIGLGGKAKYFIVCKTVQDITHVLKVGEENNLRVQIFSGGSNIIFPEKGFDGIVVKIDLKGIKFEEDSNFVNVKVKAGENWDEVVKLCIENNLAGIECLSGIPGSVGATPIQNVGAYGQEVMSTITSVKALHRKSLKIKNFSNDECKFGYRQSRFKNEDKGKYIISEVTFRLRKFGDPLIRYDELKKHIESKIDLNSFNKGKDRLNEIRKAVIFIRRKKSMVIDRNDPNSKSCGSFFLNPIINEKEFYLFKEKVNNNKAPYHKFRENYKIPAAWLVEQAGFSKGYRKGNAGISKNHSLAIINFGSSTKDILSLAKDIEKAVYEKFGIKLQKEPEIVDG